MIRPRRLLALTMLATATFALLGFPASAAPGHTVTANVFLRDLTLPVGGPTLDDDLGVFLTSDRAGWANQETLTVDTSAATGVADVTVEEVYPGVTCSTTGAVVRCTVPGPHPIFSLPDSGKVSIGTFASVMISLTPKPGAAAGDTGALTVTARADDGPTTTETSRIRLGEGVNLTAIDPPSSSVAPGGSAVLRPQVRNTGSRDVQGLTLAVNGEGAMAGTDFGNCTYDDDNNGVACAFDTTLAAGRTYQTSEQFMLQVPRDAAAGSKTGMDAQWLTRAEWQDWQDMLPGLGRGRQGTGPDLELVEVASAAAEVPQADVDGDDNGTFSTVTVTGNRRADVVAIGATITGSPGEARTINLGLVNRGPGTLRYPPFVNNLPWIEVTLPRGVAIVRADERCSTLFGGDEPSGPPPSMAAAESFGSRPPDYVCTPQSLLLRPGQRLSFTFTVRVAPGVRDGKGSVGLSMLDDGKSVDRYAGDNSAPITVSLGGGGGGLPVTGSAAAAVAGGGVLLMVIGVAVVVVLRRRHATVSMAGESIR
ncbi:hypothetical protein AB0368_02350 [Actinoplanes sp. NPDC051475]|uniref:hypothetical protein n=1 Tax=Actinoplanes sp. NPDC051475 TaxID=3157225 RepID=UPI00344D5402